MPPPHFLKLKKSNGDDALFVPSKRSSSGALDDACGPMSVASPTASPRSAPDKDMVWIPGGTFQMGSDEHYPEEAPAHPVRVSSFWIDRYQVTTAAFRRFIKATGYVTV